MIETGIYGTTILDFYNYDGFIERLADRRFNREAYDEEVIQEVIDNTEKVIAKVNEKGEIVGYDFYSICMLMYYLGCEKDERFYPMFEKIFTMLEEAFYPSEEEVAEDIWQMMEEEEDE